MLKSIMSSNHTSKRVTQKIELLTILPNALYSGPLVNRVNEKVHSVVKALEIKILRSAG